MSKEITLHLPFTKITIKKDSYYYYALPHIIADTIPAGAKTCKLTPSTTLFFKKNECLKFNLGWRKKSVTKIRIKENKMYNLPATHGLYGDVKRIFEHPIYKKYIRSPHNRPFTFRDEIPEPFLTDYALWYRRPTSYNQMSWKDLFKMHVLRQEFINLTPEEKKQAQSYKGRSNLEGDERSEMVLKKIYEDRNKKKIKQSQSLCAKITAFFDKPKSKPKKIITRPTAPAFHQPSYNPDYSGQAVTINNINNINVNVNIGCSIF